MSEPAVRVTALAAGVRLQVRVLRRDVGEALEDLLVAPLYAIVFLSFLLANGRDDLVAFALVAPVVITLWNRALFSAGEMLESERALGMLSLTAVAPAPLAVVLAGRIAVTVVIGTLAFGEAILVAVVLFDADVPLAQPAAFAAVLLALVCATSAAGLAMSALFVKARSTRIFQNALTFPAYLLGGLMMPLEVLPQPLEALGRLFFMSWAATGLRQAMTGDLTAAGLLAAVGACVAWGALAAAFGGMLLRASLRALHREGTLDVF